MPQSRDEAEDELQAVADESTQTFLRQVLAAVALAIAERRTSGAQPVAALGQMLGWWTDAVEDRVVLGIKETWRDAFSVTHGGRKTVGARSDAMAFHIAAVKDRLSRSHLPEIPEAAFDQIRLSQSAAALEGRDAEWQARDIAERLAWEPDKSYWRAQKAEAEAAIDAILDPLGKPGSPARTQAHRNDPGVKMWQAVRADAVDRIKADESEWATRARTIARTESTAAWNSGALAALADEGRTGKRWKSHIDDRTRKTHVAADGQVVPLARPFRVGDNLLATPGDPAAPAHEVINCRCIVLGDDWPQAKAVTAGGGTMATVGEEGPQSVGLSPGAVVRELRLLRVRERVLGLADPPRLPRFEATDRYAFALGARAGWLDQLRVPRGNGQRSGRWTYTPWKHLDDLVALINGLGADAPGATRQAVLESLAALDGLDRDDIDPRDPAVAEAARTVASLLDAVPPEEGPLGDAVLQAAQGVHDFADTDWSLMSEDTDIGRHDDTAGRVSGRNVWEGDLPGDEPVDPALDMTSQALADELRRIADHPVAPSPTARRKRAAYMKELADRRDRDAAATEPAPEPGPVPIKVGNRVQVEGIFGVPWTVVEIGLDGLTIESPKIKGGSKIQKIPLNRVLKVGTATGKTNTWGDPEFDWVDYVPGLAPEPTEVYPLAKAILDAPDAESLAAALRTARGAVIQTGDNTAGVRLQQAAAAVEKGDKELASRLLVEAATAIRDLADGHPSNKGKPVRQGRLHKIADAAELTSGRLDVLGTTRTADDKVLWGLVGQMEDMRKYSDITQGAALLTDVYVRAVGFQEGLDVPGREVVGVTGKMLAVALANRDVDTYQMYLSLTLERLQTLLDEGNKNVWTFDFARRLRDLSAVWVETMSAGNAETEADLLGRYGALPETRTTAEAVAADIGTFYGVRRGAVGNCVLASTAYELRRRGIDAHPKRAEKGRNAEMAHRAWFSLGSGGFGGPTTVDGSSLKGRRGPGKHAAIVQHIQSDTYPPGSRGTIRGGWKGSRTGHIWNWERLADGGVVFHDPQTGESDLGPDSDYWNQLDWRYVTIQRLDDKPLRPDVEVALAPPGYGSKIEEFRELARRIAELQKQIELLWAEYTRLDKIARRRGSYPEPVWAAAVEDRNALRDRRSALIEERDALKQSDLAKRMAEVAHEPDILDPSISKMPK